MSGPLNARELVRNMGPDLMLPFGMTDCVQFPMQSARGREYRIFVTKPAQQAPAQGYRVIYLLDGNAVFATAAETLRVQTFRRSWVEPAVIVAIGYPGDEPFDVRRRTFDLTPAAPARATLGRADGSEWPPNGGAEEFADFIEEDLKPRIAREFPVNPGSQAIFGHSFGGLFVLHMLFTRPDSFQAYAAASPSIWWKDKVILESGRNFMAAEFPPGRRLRLMMMAGALEQGPPGDPMAAANPERSEWVRKARMIENAEEMVLQLSSLPQDKLSVSLVKFSGENHISVIPAAISRAIRFFLE